MAQFGSVKMIMGQPEGCLRIDTLLDLSGLKEQFGLKWVEP